MKPNESKRKAGKPMSIRIETHGHIPVDGGDRHMREVIIYASTAEEAMAVDTADFVLGSLLYVINDGRSYMLNGDGREGEWRAVADGTPLGGEVSGLVANG
jgi:hypothetical protein